MDRASISTNLTDDATPPMLAAIRKPGAALFTGVGNNPTGGDIVVWEASQHDEMSVEQANGLGERVKQGKSLLVALARSPGLTPMRLGFMLPTTAWETATHFEDQTLPGPIEIGAWDKAFFHHAELNALVLPYHYGIRPLAAAERGQARYERYKRKIQHLNVLTGPNDEFWSRSLLNRDRQVRMRGNDIFQSPILVTGRYGAGRVAILATSAESLNDWPDAEVFWSSLLTWLRPQTLIQQQPNAAVPVLSIATQGHGVRISVRNPGPTSSTVEVVSRALTWEGALVGEADGEMQRILTLPPLGSAQVEMRLPVPSPVNYQALDALDSFEVRAGILSEDGSTLLTQKSVSADFSSQVQVSVNTDNLYQWEYPFHAPGRDSFPEFDSRMGAAVGAYAYPPGARVRAEIVLTNGQRDMAHLARAVDETKPSNPSLEAVSDGAMAFNKTPVDGVEGHGSWTGQAGTENVLSFTFPHPVTIASVVLIGSVGQHAANNPSVVSVELDGKRVASSSTLDEEFVSGNGRPNFRFSPTKTTKVTVRMPWIDRTQKRKRGAPSLGEILIQGWPGEDPAPTQGKLQMKLIDAMSGESTSIGIRDVTLKPGAVELINISFVLPSAKEITFCRLEAHFAKASGVAPILVLQPSKPLRPNSDFRPKNCASLGLIVSRGFRETFPIGTGTGELSGGWGQPDDLIWAYAHQFKEVGANARTEASRLYVTEGNMQHYVSPWRTFNNGVPFHDLATPNLVAKMRAQSNWTKSDIVVLGHSDRWDAGPDIGVLHGWQDFVEFDEHLRASGQAVLKGRTRVEIAKEIHSDHEDAWQAWHLHRYVNSVTTLREGFAKQGKNLMISAQGVPMVAGPKGAELAKTLHGMSDDHTWGMMNNNIPATTGRQLSMLAHNPVWKMSTLVQWGYNSSNLDNPQWHVPVGTTEPSRRQYYNRAWRATVWPNGSYGSMHTFGYNSNAGISFLMTQNDWQQWWLLEERHSLLSPQVPIGAGLVISSSRFADPNHIRFTAAGNTFAQSPDALTLALAFQKLHEAGLSIPFSANASALDHWKGTAPLVILNLESFSSEEVQILSGLQTRGVYLVALTTEKDLPNGAAELFRKSNTWIVPLDASKLTSNQARTLVPELQTMIQMPLCFSPGLAGYGYRMDGTSFIVLEDWLEQGRTGEVRLRAGSGMSKALACNVNDHVPLPVRRDGDDWLIAVSVRPGDGTLVAIQEEA